MNEWEAPHAGHDKTQTVPPNTAFISGRCEMKSFILIFSYFSSISSYFLSFFSLSRIPHVINRNVCVAFWTRRFTSQYA